MSRAQARASAAGPHAPSAEELLELVYRIADAVRPEPSELELTTEAYWLRGPT